MVCNLIGKGSDPLKTAVHEQTQVLMNNRTELKGE